MGIITYRNLKSVSPLLFSTALQNHLSDITEHTSSIDILAQYNSSISTVLDTHAPLKRRLVPSMHISTWFTPALRIMKAASRHLERLCKKTGLSVHLTAYKNHIQLYKSALNTARSSCYSTLINNASSQPKALFSIVRKINFKLKKIKNKNRNTELEKGSAPF